MNIPKIIIISKERKYYKEIALKNIINYLIIELSNK